MTNDTRAHRTRAIEFVQLIHIAKDDSMYLIGVDHAYIR